MEKLCNSDFSCLPMPLVSSVKINLNYQKAYLFLVSVWIEECFV